MPLPATMYIGDIYETKGLRNPYMVMKDKLSDYIQQVMETIKDDASIPDTSSESKFNIEAEADFIGEAKAELSVYGV